MSFGPFQNPSAMHDWMQRTIDTPDRLSVCVEEQNSGRPLGMAAFMNVVPQHRSLELGSIWYSPAARRTATNTETIYLMLCETFDHLAYRRVEWKCDSLNRRSRHAASRLGFSFEGVFRQHFMIKGRNRDTAWFSMLDSEWPEIKGHFERVLYGDGQSPSLRELNRALVDPDPATVSD